MLWILNVNISAISGDSTNIGMNYVGIESSTKSTRRRRHTNRVHTHKRQLYKFRQPVRWTVVSVRDAVPSEVWIFFDIFYAIHRWGRWCEPFQCFCQRLAPDTNIFGNRLQVAKGKCVASMGSKYRFYDVRCCESQQCRSSQWKHLVAAAFSAFPLRQTIRHNASNWTKK